MRACRLISAGELPAAGVFGRDVPLKDYRRLLGTERGDTFYSAAGGLSPNAFTAIAGTLTAGSTLYLCLPDNYPAGDPDHLRLLDYGENPAACAPSYNQRLRRLIEKPPEITTAATEPPAELPALQKTGIDIILGPRGRGKSTLLAAKAGWLLEQGERLLIISPYRDNRTVLSRQLPETVPSLPPDDALRRLPAASHVIIDEAAAIPPTQLLALLAHYPNATIATTQDSYEGSANTFRTQTLPALTEKGARITNLSTGRRFAAGDALETLSNRLTLSNLAEPALPKTAANAIFRRQNPNALAGDEPRLQAVWQLLSHAHYRSRPDDIKRLLDLPNQWLYTAEAGGAVLAAAIVLIENPLPDTLVRDVIAGTRRPQGRLLMQQLLAQTQNPQYAQTPIARIQRIATAPALRRQGLAGRLIARITADFAMPVGTIHSAQDSVNQFWENLGFPLIRQSAQPRSRHHGAACLRLCRPHL